MTDVLRRNLALSIATLLASTGTLVCCVLPAAMVMLGAGAALAGLVTRFPGLVWLSEHKVLVFATAGALLAVSGIMLLRSRSLPCPSEPAAAQACRRLRKASAVVWTVAVLLIALGALFAFVLPAFA